MSADPAMPPRTNIGSVVIDPAAEASTVVGSTNVTGGQEADFYKEGGEHYRLMHNQQNLGWMGIVWGSNASAPTNIAGFVIFISIIIISVSFFIPTQIPELIEARKWFFGLTTSALGFLFGTNTKS